MSEERDGKSREADMRYGTFVASQPYPYPAGARFPQPVPLPASPVHTLLPQPFILRKLCTIAMATRPTLESLLFDAIETMLARIVLVGMVKVITYQA